MNRNEQEKPRPYNNGHPNNDKSKGSGGNYTPPPPPRLPKNYLAEGYFAEKNRPFKELFIGWPEDIAVALKKGGKNDLKEMSVTGLRNFYNEARTILAIIEVQPQAFESMLENIYKLKAHAFNAAKKKKGDTMRLFTAFIEANLPYAEQSPENYRIFVSHFECVVAYFQEKE